MTAAEKAALAQRQLEGYDRRRPGPIFEDADLRISVREAFELQIEVARLREARGERIAGYKVGCVSPAVRAQLGLGHIVCGHLFETELHPSGARLDPGLYDHLAIEGEYAGRLALDAPDASRIRREGPRAFASVFPVIELHNHVFRAGPEKRAQEIIANNAIHAGVVLPEGETGPETLERDPLEVFRNGELLGRSEGERRAAGLAENLAQLAGLLAELGLPLQRGRLILTGSPLPLYAANPGDRFEARSGHGGSVECSVAVPAAAAG